MSLDSMVAALKDVGYAPRTLDLTLPSGLAKNLSVQARAFFGIAFGKENLSVLELAGDAWKDDKTAQNFFFSGSDDDRLEILAFLTLFVHEFTHRIDFLISPFGLQFYANTLREYWLLQKFVPPILDDPKTVERMRFLVGFGETGDAEKNSEKQAWQPLEELIHLFYAWGDASDVKPLGRYVTKGWRDGFMEIGDYFGVGVPLEPITVLKMFHTFRIPDSARLWYLRPLTIFETKAVVNSLLFILHLLGDRGGEACRLYYEKMYLAHRDQMPDDYFFLLDMGAAMYGLPDFHTLLKKAKPEMIRSTLLILSSICWFALQAPPPLKGEDPRISNPIIRLWLAFSFLTAYVRGQLKVSFNCLSEGLMMIESLKIAANTLKPIKDTIPACVAIIDNMLELNTKRTWNPKVRSHFHHIFTMMRPHFAERKPSYVSFLGMPDTGSPVMECRTQDDWELTYEDYKTPADVRDWFSIRTDLFFNLLKPTEDCIERLDAHYLAFFIPYMCECQQGITPQWASRFAQSYELRCGYCGKREVIRREQMTSLHVPPEK